MSNHCTIGFLVILVAAAYIGLIAGLAVAAPESIADTAVGAIVVLSFIALLLSLVRNVASKQADKPLCRFVRVQGILTAMIMEIALEYSFFTPESSFDSSRFFVILTTVYLTVFLIAHIRDKALRRTSTKIVSSLALTLSFSVSMWYLLNFPVDISVLIMFIAVHVVVIAQIVSAVIRFHFESNQHIVFCILVVFILVVYGWACNAYIAGF